MEGLDRLHSESSTRTEFHEPEGSGTTSLDPEVWGRLPFECLCCILERVPADSLIRWRRVSKTWVQSFLDIAIHGRSARMPPVGETVPLYHTQLGSLATTTGTFQRIAFALKTFNRSRNTWQILQLNLNEAQSTFSIFYDLYPSGGILLLDLWFRNLENQVESSMTMFNPTTAQSRRLPPSPDVHARPVGVLSSPDGRSYAVVATRWLSDHVGSQLLVYKSESGSWHDYGMLPREMRPSPFDSAASVGNVLYFIAQKRTSIELLQNQRLCAFDLVSGTSEELGKLPRHYGSGRPSLLQNGDDLVFVSIKWYSLRGMHRTWRIHKFNATTQRWNVKGTMPAHIYEQLNQRIDDKVVTVAGAGNCIYFYGAPSSYNFELHRVLSHNTNDGTWNWLPEFVTSAREMAVFHGTSGEGTPIFQGYPVLFPVEPSFMPV